MIRKHPKTCKNPPEPHIVLMWYCSVNHHHANIFTASSVLEPSNPNVWVVNRLKLNLETADHAIEAIPVL
jgi:hypothetical protein